MKKFAIVVLTALVAVSCLKRNDLTNYAVPAKILSFGVEGQLTVTIDAQLQKVHVLMPAYTDLTKLTVTAFSVTDGVSCEPEISVGEVLNLFEPLEVILSNEDVYVWTIDASTKEPRSGVQLYNMNFDSWTQEGKAWYAYGADATAEQKAVWGNANKTITDMGKDSNCVSETEFVAVEGEGKKALKLTTNLLDFWILKKLAAVPAVFSTAGWAISTSPRSTQTCTGAFRSLTVRLPWMGMPATSRLPLTRPRIRTRTRWGRWIPGMCLCF